jgi:alcohol dehydrogenase YqhD (iron-dependent ADH family)
MDALTHAVEAYISKDANPVTDAAAIQAIRLIARNLRQAVALGSNLKARENMAYASLLAVWPSTTPTSATFTRWRISLAVCTTCRTAWQTVLLPHVARYNLIANPEKFADIAEFMGENTDGLSTMDAAELAIRAIARLSADIGIPQHLRDLGVKEADFPYMAEMALKDGNAFSNPRKGTRKKLPRSSVRHSDQGAQCHFHHRAYICFITHAGRIPACLMSCAGDWKSKASLAGQSVATSMTALALANWRPKAQRYVWVSVSAPRVILL